MFLHTAAVNGSVQVLGRVEWDREPEVGIETGWRQPTVAAWGLGNGTGIEAG